MAQYTAVGPDNYTVWLPVFVRFDRLDGLENLYFTLVSFELIISVITLIASIYYMRVAWSLRVVHVNLYALAAYQMIWHDVNLLARIVLIPYESRRIQYDFLTDFPIPQLNFIRGIAFTNMPMFLTAVVIERTLATFCVIDYEKNKRVHICIAINGITQVIAVVFSYCIITGLIDGFYFFVLLLFPNAASALAFRRIYLRNMARYNSLTQQLIRNHSDPYTLSLRVQLNENISTMKQLQFASVSVFVGLAICVVAMFLPPRLISNEDDYWILDLAIVLENLLMAIVMLSVCSIIVFSFDNVRELVIPPSMLKYRHYDRQASTITRGSTAATSNEYFSQLEEQWSYALERLRCSQAKET